MAINPDKCIKVTGRFHSTQGTVGDPSLTNIVTGADEVYDDYAPYRTNGHIDCNVVTPTGTENPQELRWYEQIEVEVEGATNYEWVRSNDTSVDSEKTYGIPTGAKQSEINKQLYTYIEDIQDVVLYADEYNEATTHTGDNPQANGWYEFDGTTYVLTDDATVEQGKTYYIRVVKIASDENKIINQEDGYIPTAGAVGRAMGTNFEDNLQSTSTVKGLTANMGRVLNENKADINGYYETMSVGSAKNLDGETINNEAYLIRPTGGAENEVANGVASVLGMEGNSCAWNQLVNSDTTSVTLMSGRKYYTKIDGTAAVVSGADSAVSVTGGVDMVVDLTLLGIDNLTTTAQVEVCLAQHVGTKPYYAYNAGTILSSQTLGIKTYGQNLLNPSNGLAKLIPYTHTTNSNKYTVKGIPTGAAVTYTPDNTGVAVDVTEAITDNTFDISSYGIGTLYIPNATANTYVCMKRNGAMDDEIVPYKENTYNFDITKVYGKTGGSDEYVQCFPNGMRSAGSVHDSLTASYAVVKVGSIDLGSLTWSSIPSDSYKTYSKKISYMAENAEPTCAKYYSSVGDFSSINDNTIDKSLFGGSDKRFNIKDTSLAGKTDSQIATILSDVYANYKLATPITYTDLIYRDGGVDRPLTDVLMNITVNSWSMEEQLMTDYDEQGNPTSIPATIQTKYSIDAVEAIKTLEETSYFESDIHDNLQAMLTCINTNCASVLGGQFSISETATNKLFNFTFTANASTNSTEENTETI